MKDNSKKSVGLGTIQKSFSFEGINNCYMSVSIIQDTSYYRTKPMPDLVKEHGELYDYNRFDRNAFLPLQTSGNIIPRVVFIPGKPVQMTQSEFLELVGKRAVVDNSDSFFKKKNPFYYQGVVVFSSVGQKGFGAPVDNYSGALDPETMKLTDEKNDNTELLEDKTDDQNQGLAGGNGFTVSQTGVYCGVHTPSSFWVNPPSGLDLEDSLNSEFFFMAIPKEDNPSKLDLRLYISLSASVETVRVSIPEISGAYVDLQQEIGTWTAHPKFLYTMKAISIFAGNKNEVYDESEMIKIVERYVQYRGEVDRQNFRAVGRHVIIKEQTGKILVSCAPDKSYFVSNFQKAWEMLRDIRMEHILAGGLERDEIVYSEEPMYCEEAFNWKGWGIGFMIILGTGSLLWLGYVCLMKKMKKSVNKDDFG